MSMPKRGTPEWKKLQETIRKCQEVTARQQSELPKKTPPKQPVRIPRELLEEPLKKPKSDDAMDHRGFRKGGFSKAEKRAYAQEKHMEDLMQPPKAPLAEWLNDPTLLPKKPPGRDQD